MKSPEYYHNREQTYLKHFFLERYLERVAYNIGYSNDDFVYIDGFSGPWKSEDENFDDTSFMIALQKLENVREGLRRGGRFPRIRCLFVEKDPQAFRSLEKATQDTAHIQARSLCGQFEDLIPEINGFVGRSFSLVFIDPTGWTGFGLKQITPLLQHRPGEVIVNFMFDYINRFLDHPSPEVNASFQELFGGPGWEEVIKSAPHREEAIIKLYCERMKSAGNFAFVTYARIPKPTVDRTYFYLIYGTRHPKGLLEFRNVEKKYVVEQERVRQAARQHNRVRITGQQELFAASDIAEDSFYFGEERSNQLKLARILLHRLLLDAPRVSYDDVSTTLLELPLVWDSDIKDLTMELHANGEIELEGLRGRERTPKSGYVLVRKF